MPKDTSVTKEALREFARWCALQVIDKWDAPVSVREYLETGNESLREDARSLAELAEIPEEQGAAEAAAEAAAWAMVDDVEKAAKEAAWWAHIPTKVGRVKLKEIQA